MITNKISIGLCIFKLDDEVSMADVFVKSAIAEAFADERAFSFYPDKGIISQLKNGANPKLFKDAFHDILYNSFTGIAGTDQTIYNRHMQNSNRIKRLVSAISLIHKSIAENIYSSTLENRRLP